MRACLIVLRVTGLIENKPRLPFAASRRQARVSLVTYSEETGKFTVTAHNRTKDVVVYFEEFDNVAVAFGRFWTPNVLHFDGIGEDTTLQKQWMRPDGSYSFVRIAVRLPKERARSRSTRLDR